MIKKQEVKKETIWEVMRNNAVVFSMTTDDGFANIEMTKRYDGKETLEVKFYDDEGNCGEDMSMSTDTILKVSKFINQLKELTLESFVRESK